MAELPSWTPQVLGAAVFIHIAQFLVVTAASGSLLATDSNPFSFLKDLVTFGALDIPAWASLALFVLVSLPILLIVASYVFAMFGSEVGALTAIALGLVTGGLLVFF